jgi:penicillin-binding protein 1A
MSSRPPATSEPAPPRRGGLSVLWRWTKRLVSLGIVLAAIGVIALTMVLNRYESRLPSTTELKTYRPPQVTRVLARDGTVLAELFVERRTVVRIDDIPKTMKLAALAAEDADFYQHEGLDYLGMLRALIVNLRSGRMVQGGSTITQQVVKNVLLSPERTFERKAREVLLARRIEQELSKDEILELYLNHIYFGHGRYGIEEASRYYFGKGIAEVNLAEAATLAGLVKGPNIYSPRVAPDKARRRRDIVLGQIEMKGLASPRLVADARATAIELAPAVETMSELAPEAIAEAKRVLRKLVGKAAEQGGYTVTTTIDPSMQAAARKAVRDNLDAYARRHDLVPPLKKRKKEPKPFAGTPAAKGHRIYAAVVTGHEAKRLTVRVGGVEGFVTLSRKHRYNPKGVAAEQFAEVGRVLRVSAVLERNLGPDGLPREYRLELGPQSAMVAIDNASREIRALVGSYEAVRGGLDRATRSKRQPGSTFKPIVYSYLIHERKMTPATPIPVTSGTARDADAPPLRMREAVARSVNAAAVWALKEAGPANVIEWARLLGAHSPMKPTESLALGAYEMRPRELAGVYATFATGGTFEEPILVSEIRGPDGAAIALPAAAPVRRALAEDEAYVVTSLLQSVIREGTGRRANGLQIPLAGKTGTSNDARDAWFAGYSPAITCVVWTGFDDAAPLGRGEQGARTALPAWIDFMKHAHRGRKVADWQRPASVVAVSIDPASGLLPYDGQEDPVSEIYLRGTEPNQVAEPPDDNPYDDDDASEVAEHKGKSVGQAATPPPEATHGAPPPF